MRQGTRDAGWALMVLITAMGRAGRETAGLAGGRDHHDGSFDPLDDGHWDDDGEHAHHVAANGFSPVQGMGAYRQH